jgi:hypothetical protein
VRKFYVILSEVLLVSLLIISLLGSTLLLPFLRNLTNTPLQQKIITPKWTYMVYCDADNNLDSYGVEDLNEMEQGYSNSVSSYVKVICLIDRESSGATTYRVVHDTSSSIVSTVLTTGFPSEPNMGSKTTLKNFITYVFNNYPAEHYVLDLWDHGGSVYGICWDDSSSNDKLSFDEVDEAITEACIAAGETIDILAADACLIQCLEWDYEMREYVNYIVASEETIPGYGYPYDVIIDSLCTNYNSFAITPVNFADDMVQDYHDSYTSSYDTTLSCVDVTSTSINNLMDAFNLFTADLITAIASGQKTQIASARAATQEFYYEFMIDLKDFAQEVKSRIPSYVPHADLLINNISAAVTITRQHNNPGAQGIAIYFPETDADYDSGYETVIDLGEETDWDLFLTTFYSGTAVGLSLFDYVFNDAASLPGSDGDGIVEQGETVNLSLTIKNTGAINAKDVNGTISCSDGNISILAGFQDYGNIPYGTTKSRNFQFNVSLTAPTGLIVLFTFVINASFNPNYYTTEYIYAIINVSTITGGASFEAAVTINEGLTYSILPGPDPTDQSGWFKITVPEEKYLIVSLLMGGTDFDVYVYRPSGALLGAGATNYYPDTCIVYASTTGYYRMRVVPYAGSGVFTLNVTISDDRGSEDGLSYGTAFTLDNDTAMPAEGTFPSGSWTGYMYYRVYLYRGDAVDVTLEAGGGTNFDLYILDSTFKTVDSSTSASGYPESVYAAAPSEGYFYIVVVPTSGSGAFDLTVKFEEAFMLDIWLIALIVIVIVVVVMAAIILYFKMTH